MNFELFDETKTNAHGVQLFRIRATRDIPARFVSKGDVGGWVSSTHTDSGEPRIADNAWIADDAEVYGNARITGSARVYGNCRVYGSAQVTDNARVYGAAEVFGNAHVTEQARVYGQSQVSGHATIAGHARVTGYSGVMGHARVHEQCTVESATIYGNATVGGFADIYSTTVRDQATITGLPDISYCLVTGTTTIRSREQFYMASYDRPQPGDVEKQHYVLTDTTRTLPDGTVVYQIQHSDTGARGGWVPGTHTRAGRPRLADGAWLGPHVTLCDDATVTQSTINGDITIAGNSTIAFSEITGTGVITGNSYLWAGEITLRGTYRDLYLEPFSDEDYQVTHNTITVLRTCSDTYAIEVGDQLYHSLAELNSPDPIILTALRNWDN